MKKLLVGVAVLATATFAVAAPTFVLPETTIDINVDPTVDIVLTSGGTGTAGGLTLWLGSTGAGLAVSNLRVSDDFWDPNYYNEETGEYGQKVTVPGTVEDGFIFKNSNGVQTAEYPAGSPGLPTGMSAVWCDLTVPSNVPAVGNVAVVTLTGLVKGDYILTTDLRPTFSGFATWAGVNPAAQASAIIHVTPEPVSALLLLAGLPLLRRRRA